MPHGTRVRRVCFLMSDTTINNKKTLIIKFNTVIHVLVILIPIMGCASPIRD